MGGRVEVSSDSQSEADQCHQRRDRMHDKDGRESMARVCGQREVGVWLVLEKCLCRLWSIEAQAHMDRTAYQCRSQS